MAAGGAIIGFGFGLCLLLILFQLDRRFSREENIVEVMATFATAYLGYYVAEVFFKTCKLRSSDCLVFDLFLGTHTVAPSLLE